MKTLTMLFALFKAQFLPFLKVFTKASTLIITLSVSGVIEFLKIWVFNTSNITTTLVVSLIYLVIIDSTLGLIKYAKRKEISSSGFGMFAIKVIIYYCLIQVGQQLSNIKLMIWIGDFFVSGAMVREAISILENIGEIKPGFLPPRFLKMLKGFDENGKIENPISTDSDLPTQKQG